MHILYFVSKSYILECWRPGLVDREDSVPKLRELLAQERARK